MIHKRNIFKTNYFTMLFAQSLKNICSSGPIQSLKFVPGYKKKEKVSQIFISGWETNPSSDEESVRKWLLQCTSTARSI